MTRGREEPLRPWLFTLQIEKIKIKNTPRYQYTKVLWNKINCLGHFLEREDAPQ